MYRVLIHLDFYFAAKTKFYQTKNYQIIMANVFFVTVLIMALNELVSDIIKSQN